MKKLIYIVVLSVFAGIVGCCDCDHDKKCDKPHEKGKCSKDSVNDTNSATESEAEYTEYFQMVGKEVALIESGDPWGTHKPVSNGGSDGVNISVKRRVEPNDPDDPADDQVFLEFYLIGVAEGKTYKSDPYDIPVGATSSCVEIVGSTEMFNGKNVKTITISKLENTAAYNGHHDILLDEDLDVKITTGASATSGVPSIVGMDDARDAQRTEGSGGYAKLGWSKDNNKRVRLHYVENGNNPYLRISSQLGSVQTFTNWCIWTFGIPCWGLEYNDECRGPCSN